MTDMVDKSPMEKWLIFIASLLITGVFVFMGFVPKFMGTPESQYMFGQLLAERSGVALFEPYGRWGIGLAEMAIVILLWIPGKRHIAGGLAAVLMAGAVASHLLWIGVITHFPVKGETPPFDASTATQGDNGMLFSLALLVLVCGVYLVIKAKPSFMIFKS